MGMILLSHPLFVSLWGGCDQSVFWSHLRAWRIEMVVYRRVMAKNIIPKEQYRESNKLFMKNVKKISFSNFLSWMKVVEELNVHIKKLFDEQTSIPTLFLTGEDDKFFIDEVQQAVYNGGSNVSLVIVPNAGHVCNVDNKSFFNRKSLDFLRNL